MPHRATAALQKTAQHRVAAMVEFHERCERLDLAAAHSLGIDAQQAHRVGAAREQVALRFGMEQVERAALADHDIEVQLPLEPFPELQRKIVEAYVVRLEIIGADERGVAADVTKADRSALQHRHVGAAVFARQVVGGRQAVPTAAYDHHAISGARFGLGPGSRPAAVTA